jgi:hypothetical protein
VRFHSQRRFLSYFTPSQGSEHGLDYIRVFPAYNISEVWGPDLLSAAATNKTAVRCVFGPASDPSVDSLQHPIITEGSIQGESNSVICDPGYADPLLPLDVEAYRVVQLWLLWFRPGEHYHNHSFPSTLRVVVDTALGIGIHATSHLVRSELYGDFSFVRSSLTARSRDNVFTPSPIPGSAYIFDPADEHSLIAYVDFTGVNESRGSVLDLGVFVSQCRFLNGSMLVKFHNFTADPLEMSQSTISDRLATEKYRELGSFTGHFKMLSMDFLLYSAMWAHNTTLMKLDPLWCPSALANLRSTFNRKGNGRRLATTTTAK